MKDLSYSERLRKLKLLTLAYRRVRGDVIEVYKILTGKYDKDASNCLKSGKDKAERTSERHLRKPSVQFSLTLISPLADFTGTEIPPIRLYDLPFFTDRTLTIFGVTVTV
jgi:hypothetical protein